MQRVIPSRPQKLALSANRRFAAEGQQRTSSTLWKVEILHASGTPTQKLVVIASHKESGRRMHSVRAISYLAGETASSACGLFATPRDDRPVSVVWHTAIGDMGLSE